MLISAASINLEASQCLWIQYLHAEIRIQRADIESYPLAVGSSDFAYCCELTSDLLMQGLKDWLVQPFGILPSAKKPWQSCACSEVDVSWRHGCLCIKLRMRVTHGLQLDAMLKQETKTVTTSGLTHTWVTVATSLQEFEEFCWLGLAARGGWNSTCRHTSTIRQLTLQ